MNARRLAADGDPESPRASPTMKWPIAAKLRAGIARSPERKQGDVVALRHQRSGQADVFPRLSAGPPDGGARRAFYQSLSRRLGRSFRRFRESHELCGATIRARGVGNGLKQRGLLDETLVIWGGEFGRTPMSKPTRPRPRPGRDHHPRPTHVAAGGGAKAGLTFAPPTTSVSTSPKPRPRSRHPARSCTCSASTTTPDLPPPGPRLPADGCAWEGRSADSCVNSWIPKIQHHRPLRRNVYR